MPNRRFGKKIDVVHWTYGSFAFVNKGAGTFAVNVFAAQHLPETHLRFRGEWVGNMVGAAATQAGMSVAAGLILVPEGTDTTVLWSPITDGDAPWIWWDTFGMMYSEQVTDVAYSTQTSSARRVIDSKAMRKVRNTEVQCVVELAAPTGLNAINLNVFGSLRSLDGS